MHSIEEPKRVKGVRTMALNAKRVRIVSISDLKQQFQAREKIETMKRNGRILRYEIISLDKTDLLLSIMNSAYAKIVIDGHTRLGQLLLKAIRLKPRDKETLARAIWASIKQISLLTWGTKELYQYYNMIRRIGQRLERQLNVDEFIIIIINPYLNLAIKYIMTRDTSAVREIVKILKR